jgi:[acyl-carrier-protein] S-malonyltransferase
MKTTIIFSGQGAQYPGMGKELYGNYAVCREIFDK